jgi:hypothetical protein
VQEIILGNLPLVEGLAVLFYAVLKQLGEERLHHFLLTLVQVPSIFEFMGLFYQFQLCVEFLETFADILMLFDSEGPWRKLDKLRRLNRLILIVEGGHLSLLGQGQLRMDGLVLNQIIGFVQLNYKLILRFIWDLGIPVISHMLVLHGLVQVLWAVGGCPFAQSQLSDVLWQLR